MRCPRVFLGSLLAIGLLAFASPTAAHPLGNAAVSQALGVELRPGEGRFTAILDMAEIPAFAAMLEIDADGDGAPSAVEQASWAEAKCQGRAADIRVEVDERGTELTRTAAAELSFPPGVGDLETLRLVCHLSAPLPDDGEGHRIAVTEATDAEWRGWREVTITATGGLELLETDVPSVSPSAFLTSYPEDLLTTPVDVRSGTASFGPAVDQGALAAPAPSGAAVAGPPSDPLADLLALPRTPVGWLAAVALALGLGAAHALSPGHGKALIAAYAVGSRSSMGHAVGLGLSAAASHTIGVLALGAIVLTASELLVPERVVAWLSVGSGVLVIVVGAMVAGRTLRGPATTDPGHAHEEDHHDDDGHAHGAGDHHHRNPGHGSSPTGAPLREILTLGLIGGAVPSTSALLVLLVAVSTGQVAQGLVLIAAFGAGMAIVLGGLAAVTGIARSRLAGATARVGLPSARRLAAAAPLVSAMAIMAVGAVTTIGALGSLL